MVTIENNTITIIIECEDAPKTLQQLRNALTIITAVLVESDEFYNNTDLPGAISSLIKLQGHLCTEKES